MKQAILIVLTILFSARVSAQSSVLDKIFDKYSGKQGYTSVYVSKAMFDLFKTISDDKDKDFKEVTSRLTSIKILAADDKKVTNAGNSFYKEMVRALALPEYQDLMVVNDGGEEIKFIIRKTGDRINELIMVAGGDDACLIALDGDIDLKQVSKLSKSMNIKGLEHLSNVNTKNK